MRTRLSLLVRLLIVCCIPSIGLGQTDKPKDIRKVKALLCCKCAENGRSQMQLFLSPVSNSCKDFEYASTRIESPDFVDAHNHELVLNKEITVISGQNGIAVDFYGDTGSVLESATVIFKAMKGTKISGRFEAKLKNGVRQQGRFETKRCVIPPPCGNDGKSGASKTR